MTSHIPVLLSESIEALNIKNHGIYCDMTFGRGGHTKAIFDQLKVGTLIAFDLDLEAQQGAKELNIRPTNTFKLVHANFKDLDLILDNLNIDKVDGFLFDLGVSSPQFDDPERGFSYRFDTRLDMRMNQEDSLTAYEIVNTYSQNDLTRIFYKYGEEKFSSLISKNIVKYRQNKKIETTGELVEIIKNCLPKRVLLKDKHPAKQVFQALRICVNKELESLEIALEKACSRLKPNGRCVVITYHSLEDRIVKKYFNQLAIVEGNRLNLPINIKESDYRLINKKVILPSQTEIDTNYRSHSAKLRIIERK